MLVRCATAVGQLIWPTFEIVVVADKAGRDALKGRSDIKLVACDQPNLALARNLGISQASGDIICFIDDDAVPEPMWLAALASAFEDAAVGAATGPVLGRNGISFQSGAQSILANGQTSDARRDPARRRMNRDRAPKTVGTNMAFRADLLRSVGGFNNSLRYFLEDSDLNMRLGKLGAITAYEPLAVVHHATAASDRRRYDRTPIDLYDIGRSTSIFVRRYCSEARDEAITLARQEQLGRIDRKLVSGHLEPRQARRLRMGFEQGVSDGLRAEIGTPRPVKASVGAEDFLPFQAPHPGHAIVCADIWHSERALAAARDERAMGRIVSLFVFSRTALYHRVEHRDGIWIQRGGVYGRSDRSQAMLRLFTLGQRFELEIARVSKLRGLSGHFSEQMKKKTGPSLVRLSFY